MLKHNFLIALRGFKKNKTSFLINIIGLSSGLVCVIFIFLWVNDELRMDKFHDNESNLYQVITNLPFGNEILTFEDSPFLLSENIVKEFPEVETAVAINADFCTPYGIFSEGENKQSAKGMFVTDNFFRELSFKLLTGDKTKVLTDKHNVVLSEELAIKLFGSKEKAIGKTIDWTFQWTDGGGEETLLISGVFENPSSYSTLQFDYVVNFSLLIDRDSSAGDWSGHYAKSLLVLNEETNISNFNKKIASYLVEKRGDDFEMSSFLQKFSERYLKSPYENGVQIGGRIVYVKLFSIIALFILLIACVNFMNLSTAQASRKMKEIGVKKTVGASRRSLVIQYLTESVLLSFFSLIIAFFFVFLLLPQFNSLTEKAIKLNVSFNESIILIGIVLLTGLLAGCYPAFRLSSFKTVEVLKGKLSPTLGEFWIRKGLVVFQFSVSIIFILGVLVINKQIEYTQTTNLGYDRDNVIRFKVGSSNKNVETFLAELKKIKGVKNAATMNGDFLDGLDNNSGWIWNENQNSKELSFQSPRMGYSAIETLGMELVVGRTFSKEYNDDYSKIVINEAALRLMDLENPVGTLIQKGNRKQEIIGVVKDFQYGSIHKKIEPLIIRFREAGNDVMVKVGSFKTETISQIEDVFEQFNPGATFDYSFLDSDYQALYKAEEKVANLSKYFGGLAILISCLGLFGLAAFTAEKRAKEIGIRKVLGSSISGIMKLFSLEYVKMILFAIVFATPIGYWISSRWLENFAYTISLQWWYFVLAALIVISIALLTVFWHSYKAASANPVKSLQTE